MIGDLLSPKRVFLDLRALAKEELLRSIVARLIEHGELAEDQALLGRLIDRERLMTTAVKQGFAFPHAFSERLEALQLTVGVVPGGADYEALDGRPVEVIFLLLGPPARQDRHLRVLARLSRIASEPGILDAFREATSPDEIIGLLSESDRLLAAAL